MRKVELLAPAGDAECLEYALAYGADAVYLGAKAFGMRSSCANFTEREIATAVSLAHSRGKKVYLTLNTLPASEELAGIPGLVRRSAATGIDAFIVADLGVLDIVRRNAPGTDIHFSTQMGIVNHAAARVAHEMGATRVILARELSLEDIATIRKNTPQSLELEVFVHGAMCMSVSGRCLLSGALAGRDGNRGRCAQPCRWKYALCEEKRPGEYFEIGEDEAGSYILSADDLCAAPFLDKVIAAGASSLKIEGRAKSFYYVAAVTAAYRAALNAALAAPRGQYRIPAFAAEEVLKVSHRPYSSGFFFGRQHATQSPGQARYIRQWQPVGVVGSQHDGFLYCVQRGKFELGQVMEALLPEGRSVAWRPAALYDGEGRPIAATPHTQMPFIVPAPEGQVFPARTILRRENTPQGE